MSSTLRYRLSKMRPKQQKILDSVYKWTTVYPIKTLIVIAFLFNLVMEMLNRRSVSEGFLYIFKNPLMFLLNGLIILLTLSFSLFFKRRKFLQLFILTLWLSMGIGNFVLLSFRTTPLSFIDFYILKS